MKALSDRVVVLYQGRMCEVGPSTAVYSLPSTILTRKYCLGPFSSQILIVLPILLLMMLLNYHHRQEDARFSDAVRIGSGLSVMDRSLNGKRERAATLFGATFPLMSLYLAKKRLVSLQSTFRAMDVRTPLADNGSLFFFNSFNRFICSCPFCETTFDMNDRRKSHFLSFLGT